MIHSISEVNSLDLEYPHKYSRIGNGVNRITLKAQGFSKQKISYRRKYQIFCCRAYTDTWYVTLWAIETQRGEKQKGLLLERKNILATAKSLTDRITGSMWLREDHHIILIVQKYHKRFAEQCTLAEISYNLSYFDPFALDS